MAATPSDVERAIEAGLDSLASSSGFVGLEVGFIGGYVAAQTWYTTSGSDIAIVEEVDRDVSETAWWLLGSSPPAEGERTMTTASVSAGDALYEANDSKPWSLRASGRPMLPLSAAVVLDQDVRSDWLDQLGLSGAEVTRQKDDADGTVWTVTSEVDSSSYLFYVRSEGYLASWTWEEGGHDRLVDDTNPIDRGGVTFEPLASPAQLPVPVVGEPLDLSVFDLPEGFGLSR